MPVPPRLAPPNPIPPLFQALAAEYESVLRNRENDAKVVIAGA